MDVLIKIKASSLVETITASVIIIVVFTLASFTLNNVFSSTVKNDTSSIKNHLQKMEYAHNNKALVLPFHSEFEDWEILVSKIKEKGIHWMVFEAAHKINGKKVINRSVYVEV